MIKPVDNPYVQLGHDLPDIDNITEDTAEKEVELLREAVEYHNYLYYVKNNPIISDSTFDRLYNLLENVEEKFDLITETSPTHRVGGQPVDELETVDHVAMMLSLDSSEEESEVRQFDKRVRKTVDQVQYHVEPKFDGLSVEIVYEDGEFIRAVTRGDGQEGDNISHNIKTIRTLPIRLQDTSETIVLRGEVFMPLDGFQELNKKRIEHGDDPFANPRNAAAGTVRQLDPKKAANRPLDIFLYDIMDSSETLSTQEEVSKYIRGLGLPVSDLNRLVDDIKGFIDYREELLETRDNLNFEIDGVVAKVNSIDLRSNLGTTATHPRWAYAYKFPPKTEITMVQDIAVSVGRTGKLTPIAMLHPVDVGGVTISRASLHNEKQVRKLGVSKGAKIKIERAGDVIPQVAQVIEEGGDIFTMPDTCPVCSSKVIGDEENHFCTGGISCPAQLKGRLEYFGSQDAMDIEGLGEKVAAQLVEQDLVVELPDLYELNKSDLIILDKFADKSAQNLLDEINESKTIDLPSFITALGIKHVGKETARTLAENYTIDQLLEVDENDLRALDDIGPEIATSITGFFNTTGRELVQKLLEKGITPLRKQYGNVLDGLKIVITGALENYTRQEITELLQDHGADVTSAVSSVTNYLVVGDNPGSTKLKDAEEHNVEILDEEQFNEKILSKL